MSSSISTVWHESTGDSLAQRQWWEKHVALINARRTLTPMSGGSPRGSLAPMSPRQQMAMSPRQLISSPRQMGNSLAPTRRGLNPLSPRAMSPRSLANYPPFTNEPFYPGFKPSTGNGRNTGPVMPGKLESIAAVEKKEDLTDDDELKAIKEAVAMRKKEAEALRAAAEQQVHVKFGNIRKAFQHLDKDGSGTIGVKEFDKFLRGANLNMTDAQIQDMIDLIDTDKNGEINYDEFVDGLSRETVALAAKGKRGMQSLEAMGEDAFALLDKNLSRAAFRKRSNLGASEYISEKEKFEKAFGTKYEEM